MNNLAMSNQVMRNLTMKSLSIKPLDQDQKVSPAKEVELCVQKTKGANQAKVTQP